MCSPSPPSHSLLLQTASLLSGSVLAPPGSSSLGGGLVGSSSSSASGTNSSGMAPVPTALSSTSSLLSSSGSASGVGEEPDHLTAASTLSYLLPEDGALPETLFGTLFGDDVSPPPGFDGVTPFRYCALVVAFLFDFVVVGWPLTHRIAAIPLVPRRLLLALLSVPAPSLIPPSAEAPSGARRRKSAMKSPGSR